ncbi:MAG: DUF433 domain-containing protein [Thiohalocapsa sp.]
MPQPLTGPLGQTPPILFEFAQLGRFEVGHRPQRHAAHAPVDDAEMGPLADWAWRAYRLYDGLSRRIAIERSIRFGKPCVRGNGIRVGGILSYLASGIREAQILAGFPQLTREDVRACLAFAAEQERAVVSLPAT